MRWVLLVAGLLASCAKNGASIVREEPQSVPPLAAYAQIAISSEKPSTKSGSEDIGRKHLLRKAFVMTVNAGQENEYEKRHRAVWPDFQPIGGACAEAGRALEDDLGVRRGGEQ